MTPNPAFVLLRALDDLHVDYTVVGSFASGAHGEPRATQDLDLVVRIPLPALPQLAAALGHDFYFDVESAEDALRRGHSFNIISNRNMMKFDFFPAHSDELGASQLARKSLYRIDALDGITVPVASPEDTILAKLRWFHQTGRTSEKQWNDILGVIRVQAARLDWPYIESWAPRLGVADLLARLPRPH